MFSLMMCTANLAQAQLLTGYDQEPLLAPEPVLEPEIQVAESAPILSPAHEAASQPQIITEPIEQSVVYQPLMTYQDIKIPEAVNNEKKGDPVDLDADSLSYDDQNEIVIASGDVFLAQSGRILRADEVAYTLPTDTVKASGNVVLNEENGDVYLSDEVEYNSQLKNGTVKNLRTVLNDGSRFRAEDGERKNGTQTIMRRATYTPCEICGDDPEKAPVWGIRASEVTHDQEDKRISYKHARFEAWGVPIAYTPYFSHPDGTIKQKSGFLSPSLGYRSELGAFVESNYYWAIGPDQDLTVGVMAMTEQNPLGLLEYRKRWNEASLEINGSITSSDRNDRTTGQTVQEKDELRGHVFAEGRWDINEKWRSGINVNWASDDQYLRQYDFDNDEDVLENEIYAERFSGRNYASARLLAFNDTRIREQPLDQPDVLPEIVASFKGEPGAVPLVKGRWSLDTSVLGLRREGDEQDVSRFSVDAGWSRRLISDYGLLTSVDASVRGDIYHSSDRTDATAGSGNSRSSTDMRAFPQIHVQSSYPMARQFENMQAKIEPVVSLTAAPSIDIDNQIPNEDSNDVQIDTSNLFERNRFPGLDRVEDKSRVTYGLRTGLYGYGGSYGDIFIGQSYRLDDGQNPFPNGSGLDTRESDVVGQITGRYEDTYTLDYRFQLDSRHLTSQRHEIDAFADWNRFRLSSQYLFAKALAGTDITESREQMTMAAQYYVTPSWRLTSGATHDFGEDEGLRTSYLGLDYLGQCLFFSLTGEKNFTRESSGDSGTEILFRIGLKNLGEFEETGYRSEGEVEQACQLTGL